MEEHRGSERAEEVLRQPEDLPDAVDRAGRSEDVDRERAHAEEREQRRGGRPLAPQGREADQQVENADEREEEVGKVDVRRRGAARRRGDFTAADDRERVGKRRLREGADRHPQVVEHLQVLRAQGRVRGLGIGRGDHLDLSPFRAGVHLDPGERLDLPLEREKSDGKGGREKEEKRCSPEPPPHLSHSRASFSNTNATHSAFWIG